MSRDYYQERDFEIVDYEMVDGRRAEAAGFTEGLRGPEIIMGDGPKLVAFVGAAQTFGCFATEPYPTLVARALGVRWANLGVGGAGPSHFLEESYQKVIRQADLTVVQVMSGRSSSNSLFESYRGLEAQIDRSTGESYRAEDVWSDLMRTRRADVLRLREETVGTWIHSYHALAKTIVGASILFWFSKRAEDYEVRLQSVWSLFGGFPQLIDSAAVDAICGDFDRYVRCVSHNGLPQTLVSRFTGEPVAPAHRPGDAPKNPLINDYYPSPEMHREAASQLIPSCAELLGLTAQIPT